MITAPPGVRVLVWSAPVDFRSGMDRLAALVQVTLRLDPFAGDVFVFRSRPAQAARLRRHGSGPGDEEAGERPLRLAQPGDRRRGPAVGAAAVGSALRSALGAFAGSAGAASDGRLLRGMMWI
jgi:IS66 Orf2 like protein